MKTYTVQEHNLLVCAAITAMADPRDFTMEKYFNHGNNVRPDRRSCNTPACVIGNYAYSPAQTAFVPCLLSDKSAVYIAKASDPEEPVQYDAPPVRRHFGITLEEAGELFGSDGCGDATTPDEAATYIRKFVERKRRRRVAVEKKAA